MIAENKSFNTYFLHAQANPTLLWMHMGNALLCCVPAQMFLLSITSITIQYSKTSMTRIPNTKTCLFKYIENFTTKKEMFR